MHNMIDTVVVPARCSLTTAACCKVKQQDTAVVSECREVWPTNHEEGGNDLRESSIRNTKARWAPAHLIRKDKALTWMYRRNRITDVITACLKRRRR
jgi:hypothetical protein